MTRVANYLENIGLVTNSQRGRVRISLIGSGCTACHNSLCMLGDSKAREVEIIDKKNLFKTGDEVMIKINPASGYMAVLLLYLVPFLLMLLTILLMMHSGSSEGISGIMSLLILAPYFGMIYMLRGKLSSQCKIVVEKR
jgi:positive regulator of sigma E activity